MPKITEEEIEFNFKEEMVLKYDETTFHDSCKGNNKKGVDFLYKVDSNLLLIEVKDYDTDISKKTSNEVEKILKSRNNSLEIEEANPYEKFGSNGPMSGFLDFSQSNIIWKGLNLINYTIIPHYKSDHPESAAVNKVVDYYKSHNIPFKTISDGNVIVIE